MARDTGTMRLTRIAGVRGLRLERAAAQARIDADGAAAMLRAAEEQARLAGTVHADALASFAATPGCKQAQFWRQHASDARIVAQTALADARAEAEFARLRLSKAVQAVARHVVRTDTIAAHHHVLARAERLQAEIKAEIDMPMAVHQVAL